MSNEEKPNTFTQEVTIIDILKQKNFTDNFSLREIVVETGGEYPREIPLTFINKQMDKLDGFRLGDKVKVVFSLEGRENPRTPGQWFLSARCFHIERVLGGSRMSQPDMAPIPPKTPPTPPTPPKEASKVDYGEEEPPF